MTSALWTVKKKNVNFNTLGKIYVGEVVLCYHPYIVSFTFCCYAIPTTAYVFCLSTGVPRHSAGGVGLSYVRAYVVRIIRNARAQVMEAENSMTLTIYSSVNAFIALGCRSEIRNAMNTMHAQSICYTFSLWPNTIHVVFLLQAASVIALCHSEHICDQVA